MFEKKIKNKRPRERKRQSECSISWFRLTTGSLPRLAISQSTSLLPGLLRGDLEGERWRAPDINLTRIGDVTRGGHDQFFSQTVGTVNGGRLL